MTACLPGFRALPVSVAQVSLDAVLRCGQSFRWTQHALSSQAPTHEWRYCMRDRVLCLRQTNDFLFYKAIYPDGLESSERDLDTVAWLRDYFQLHIDLEQQYASWSERDPVFASLRHRFVGIRVLRQPVWETLVSFICSSNNNISRITKMVQNLSSHFSLPLLSLPNPSSPDEMITYHPFPNPSDLAAPEVSVKLRALGFGYRAEFIQRTAQMLIGDHGAQLLPGETRQPAEKWLDTLRSMSTEDARNELLKFIGVGRKVADCVALMALDKHEVVPVDTHVHQIAVKHYKLKGIKAKSALSPKLYDEVANRLAQVWGDYAGWAHVVIFTADLKSFSDYGLDPEAAAASLPTPPLTPMTSPAKRKAAVITEDSVIDSSSPRTRSKRRKQIEESRE
ncbi:DNA glycosylase [Flagelloscypha sp. PMI_526]|nr:DNA glycosylase [Flagelloscypha sp. PMI_526]